MSNVSVLNNVEHKDLKVDTSKSTSKHFNVNRSVVYVTEVADLHKEFPILISKSESSQLQLHTVLGFEKDENLFLDEGGWNSRFVPALLARGPFSLGYPNKDSEAESPIDPVICIDVDDDRVSEEEGESLFMPFGGETPYLNYIKSALKSIELGIQYDKTLFAMIEEFDLLEPVSINIKMSNVEEINFNHYFTIDQSKLAGLDAQQIEKLSKTGVLSILFFIISSLNNFQYLIDIKTKSAQ